MQPRVAPTPQRGRPKSRRATSDASSSQLQQQLQSQQISSAIAKLEYADVIKPIVAAVEVTIAVVEITYFFMVQIIRFCVF